MCGGGEIGIPSRTMFCGAGHQSIQPCLHIIAAWQTDRYPGSAVAINCISCIRRRLIVLNRLYSVMKLSFFWLWIMVTLMQCAALADLGLFVHINGSNEVFCYFCMHCSISVITLRNLSTKYFSASEVTTLQRYTNLFIIIIITTEYDKSVVFFYLTVHKAYVCSFPVLSFSWSQASQV